MLFSLNICLVLFNILFLVGILGLFFSLRSNFFIIIAVEIMFLSINLNFFFFSIFLNSIQGILFLFYIMIISACEIVVLLSFFILFYKRIYIFDLTESLKVLKY